MLVFFPSVCLHFVSLALGELPTYIIHFIVESFSERRERFPFS